MLHHAVSLEFESTGTLDGNISVQNIFLSNPHLGTLINLHIPH